MDIRADRQIAWLKTPKDERLSEATAKFVHQACSLVERYLSQERNCTIETVEGFPDDVILPPAEGHWQLKALNRGRMNILALRGLYHRYYDEAFSRNVAQRAGVRSTEIEICKALLYVVPEEYSGPELWVPNTYKPDAS
jgi:hypothetical protein